VGVSEHLRVDPQEYDEGIRTYVPHYEELLDGVVEALSLLSGPHPEIVDLGVGTGALAERCLERWPGARVVGIDVDPAMLQVARARLEGRGEVELVTGEFGSVPIPPCDAVVACLSLHHVASSQEKRSLYGRCHGALRPGGLLVSGDRFTATDPELRAWERRAWLAHLELHYTAEEAEEHLEAWAEEDVYRPLERELAWLDAAGLVPDVPWRADGFAVVVGRRPRGRRSA